MLRRATTLAAQRISSTRVADTTTLTGELWWRPTVTAVAAIDQSTWPRKYSCLPMPARYHDALDNRGRPEDHSRPQALSKGRNLGMQQFTLGAIGFEAQWRC